MEEADLFRNMGHGRHLQHSYRPGLPPGHAFADIERHCRRGQRWHPLPASNRLPGDRCRRARAPLLRPGGHPRDPCLAGESGPREGGDESRRGMGHGYECLPALGLGGRKDGHRRVLYR